MKNASPTNENENSGFLGSFEIPGAQEYPFCTSYSCICLSKRHSFFIASSCDVIVSSGNSAMQDENCILLSVEISRIRCLSINAYTPSHTVCATSESFSDPFTSTGTY